MPWLLIIIVSATNWNDVPRREEHALPSQTECLVALGQVHLATNATAFCVPAKETR